MTHGKSVLVGPRKGISESREVRDEFRSQTDPLRISRSLQPKRIFRRDERYRFESFLATVDLQRPLVRQEAGMAVTMIRMHRDLRQAIRSSELSRPFKWRFCSETDVAVWVETQADATKVVAMAHRCWNGRTIEPHQIHESPGSGREPRGKQSK